MKIKIVGGGLAGSEAALQIAKRGIEVELYEMRPVRMTEAHRSDSLAEIVCSNSLGSLSLEDGRGLLKEELRSLDSFLLQIAYETQVPAGKALAIDREKFSKRVSELVESNPLIKLVRKEVTKICPDTPTIVATGPLSSEEILKNLASIVSLESLFFYDAISPIVTKESLDLSKMFFGARYEQSKDYLNAPMNKEEYSVFYEALINAQEHIPHDFDKKYFEACLPIEEIAKRGFDTMRFGPLTPKGFGEEYFAVVQLRRENLEGTLYELVGFQTSLSYSEQKRVFSLIPGLNSAEFVRFGSIHKNTYIKSSSVLKRTLQTRQFPLLFFAGQITGVEGYVESIATGLISGINASRLVSGKLLKEVPDETMLGSLIRFIIENDLERPQPMRANYGLIPKKYFEIPKNSRKMIFIKDSLSKIKEYLND